MTATVLKIPPRSSRERLECSSCGASAKAACDCGAPYVPAGKLAAKAVAENPAMSNVAIASDIGVSHETVRRARQKSTSTNVEVRTGRDGKTRKPPKSNPVVIDGEIISQREAKRIARELDEIKLLTMRDQINGFIDEITKFEDHIVPRLTVWRVANPEIEPEGQDALVLFLTNFSIRIANLAQKIDGR